ncbi:zinc ABC transporter substrate-binding protein [Streptomyces capparidis]
MNVRSRPAISAALAGAALLCLTSLTACGSDGGGGGSDGKVDAVASFYPLEYVTERIGGSHVRVTNLTKPGVEPHDMELSPRQTAELGEADLVVYLKGLQPAVDEAVEQAGVEHVAEASEYSHLEEHAEAGHEEEGHEEEGHEGEEHAHEGGDPHIWLDPTRLADVAEGVRDELVATDPDHADDYKANTAALVKELNALDKEFKDGLADVRSRTFITSHAAFGYLAERYDLEQVAINGVDPESEPSPAHLADLQRTAREKKVSTVFFETLASPKTAKTLAKDLGLKTAVLDPLEGVQDPEKENYFSVMRQNLKNLEQALSTSGGS